MIITRYLLNKWVPRARILSEISTICIPTSMFIHTLVCTRTHMYIHIYRWQGLYPRKQSHENFLKMWFIYDSVRISAHCEPERTMQGTWAFGGLAHVWTYYNSLILPESREFFQKKTSPREASRKGKWVRMRTVSDLFSCCTTVGLFPFHCQDGSSKCNGIAQDKCGNLSSYCPVWKYFTE